jgi:acyl-CoA hydrolase
MMKHEEKFCPRCGTRFECKAGSVALCQCNTIRLNAEERDYLQRLFNDCLCGKCMQELRSDYHLKFSQQNQKLHAMNIEERINDSVSRIFKAVFPNTTNHYDTLFGGTAMHLMDEVAFITATRFSRMRMVTVSSDKIDFRKPIPHGTIIELIGKVSKVGNTSLQVRVDIYVEEMYSQQRQIAVSGNFTLVALSEDKQPARII